MQWLIHNHHQATTPGLNCHPGIIAAITPPPFLSAAVSLNELAQAGPLPVTPSCTSVAIRVGKGLMLEDTQQQLCFGDSPQVKSSH